MTTQPSDETRPRCLIVEDHDKAAKALKALIIHGIDWGATVAPTLAEARAYLSECPDAVLLDLTMPDGDGEDLIDDIRDRCPGCRIVVVTGLVPGARMDAVAARGPHAIVQKPYYPDVLLDAVRGPSDPPAPG